MEKEKPPAREREEYEIEKVVVDFEKTYLRARRILSPEFDKMTDDRKIELMRTMIVEFTICFKEIFEGYGLKMDFKANKH